MWTTIYRALSLTLLRALFRLACRVMFSGREVWSGDEGRAAVQSLGGAGQRSATVRGARRRRAGWGSEGE
jgi:hypothetical protein